MRSVLAMYREILEGPLSATSRPQDAALKDRLRVKFSIVENELSKFPLMFGIRIVIYGVVIVPFVMPYMVLANPIILTAVLCINFLYQLHVLRVSLASAAELKVERSAASTAHKPATQGISGRSDSLSTTRSSAVAPAPRPVPGALLPRT
jgi:hypothetical protein